MYKKNRDFRLLIKLLYVFCVQAYQTLIRFVLQVLHVFLFFQLIIVVSIQLVIVIILVVNCKFSQFKACLNLNSFFSVSLLVIKKPIFLSD